MNSGSVRGIGSVATMESSPFMTPLAQRIRTLSTECWGKNAALEMVGFSPRFRELQSKLEKAARYREPVLITGESGVGKEAFAQAIYLLGSAKGRPYVSINCPQHQDGSLTVSELFGHMRGSFTGAVSDRRGAFEEADGGVIFLDEVGDLHLNAQAMLLRVLQTGEFKPLGATRARSADVRVVSATNRSLNALVLTSQFRYDLLFRLWYFHLAVPSLRDRGDDWRLIVDYCLQKLAQKYGIAKQMSNAALRALEGYHWPGNVRQLISVVTMGYAMAEGTLIEPDDFVGEFDKSADPPGSSQPLKGVMRDDAWRVPGDAVRDGAFPAQASGDSRRPETALAAPATDGGRELYDRIAGGGHNFWDAVYTPFMDRDLNRSQVRAVVKAGLGESGGSYRRLLAGLGMPPGDYQRFMDFLRHHNLKP